jgi:MOSC domain-containing protein YiiM
MSCPSAPRHWTNQYKPRQRPQLPQRASRSAAGEALTLIEAEALEDVGLTGAQSRRQVVVRGVRVNDLVGKRFHVGDVECLGVELCEPCRHLQKLTRPGIIKDLIHRGGLRVDILSGGTISIGDKVPDDLLPNEPSDP